MILYLSVALWVAVCVPSIAAENYIENKGIYVIESKSDKGVITVSLSDTTSAPVYLRSLNDSAGQKWKSHKPILFKSFELRPTSNDQASLDVDTQTLNLLARTGASGDAMYWYIKDVGESSFQMKNLQFGTCLTSHGLNKLIVLANCENSAQQQWAFTKL